MKLVVLTATLITVVLVNCRHNKKPHNKKKASLKVSMHPSPSTLDDNDVQLYTGKMPDNNDGQVHTGEMMVDDDGQVYFGKYLNEGDGEYETEKPFECPNLMNITDGELYQCDILLTEEQWIACKLHKALDSLSQRWTEGADGYPLVPYVFLDALEQNVTREALDYWMEHTCITFKETSSTSQPHLQFFNGSSGECWSYVGMIYTRNGQKVSIGDGCNKFSTIVHEVGHAIGFWHEHSRSDRDDYLVLLLENVEEDYHFAFDKQADNHYGVPYDYSSIMHYGTTFFSSNGNPTIITKDPLAQGLIGSRNLLTHRDKLLANRMYGCLGKWIDACPGLSTDPCLNDGYTQANCTCACPPGTTGSSCETVTGDYYAAMRDLRNEKITTETTITVKSPMSAGETFVKWIVPPTNKSAKVDFTFGDMYSNCVYQYLNVRSHPTDYNGEKLCAADLSGGRIFTSETGIIITMTNNVNYGSMEITLWVADVTFEDLPTTTEAPPPNVSCAKKPQMYHVRKGAPITITSPGFPEPYTKSKLKCGWKLKAKWNDKLEINCPSFQLNFRDKFKVNKKIFKYDIGPPSLTSKWFGITFLTKRRGSGPGFTCVVSVI